MKLAECLLRRKELQEKVNRIEVVKKADIFEVKARRVKVTDDVEDFIAEVPKLALSQVTGEYDHYAKQLRLIDAAIQQSNWTTEVPGVDGCFVDYVEKD
jgi:hypothetical protein